MKRAIYHVSSRPEAYEVWGEVSKERARAIAGVIVRQAAMRFPQVEFRISEGWAEHGQGMNQVAAYIEKHWERWAAGVLDPARGEVSEPHS